MATLHFASQAAADLYSIDSKITVLKNLSRRTRSNEKRLKELELQRASSQQPIYKLPDDVLQEVFKVAVDDVLATTFGFRKEKSEAVEGLRTTLCSVSSRFRRVTLASPTLWTDVVFSLGSASSPKRREKWAAYIERCGEAPIRVQVNWFGRYGVEVSIANHWLVSNLLQKASSLRICHFGWDSGYEYVLAPSSFVFLKPSTIRKLDLHNPHFKNLSILLGFLMLHQGLQELILTSLSVTGSSTPAESLCLPHLRDFKLRSSWRVALRLISCLRLPKCEDLYIGPNCNLSEITATATLFTAPINVNTAPLFSKLIVANLPSLKKLHIWRLSLHFRPLLVAICAFPSVIELGLFSVVNLDSSTLSDSSTVQVPALRTVQVAQCFDIGPVVEYLVMRTTTPPSLSFESRSLPAPSANSASSLTTVEWSNRSEIPPVLYQLLKERIPSF